jgi:hypothetical protein
LKTEKPLVQVFQYVLFHGVATKKNFPHPQHQAALELCFRNGWLYAETLELEDPPSFAYYFASPLHRWFVQAQLGTFGDDTPIDAGNLLHLVLGVIPLFSPAALLTERKIPNLDPQRPLEAQFQDEFSRCFNIYTHGARLFPEFGTNDGRIDFFIPSKKWGVELLRQGDDLRGHCGRFSTSGTYAKWVETEDYIVLDFRINVPRDPHPSKPLAISHSAF